MLLTCVKWYAVIHIYWIIMLSFWSLSTSPLLSLLMFILIPLNTYTQQINTAIYSTQHVHTCIKLSLFPFHMHICLYSVPKGYTHACSRYPKVTRCCHSIGGKCKDHSEKNTGSPSSPSCIFPSTWWDLVNQLTEWSCWRGKRALAKSPRLYDTQNCRVPFLLWEPSRCWNRQGPSGCKTHTYT